MSLLPVITGVYHLAQLTLVSREMGVSLMLSSGPAVDGSRRNLLWKKKSVKGFPCQLASIVVL